MDGLGDEGDDVMDDGIDRMGWKTARNGLPIPFNG